MNAWMRWLTAALAISIGINTSSAQLPLPKSADAPAPPAATAIAATVNGQEIPELAVYRGLLSKHPSLWKAARKDILEYLVDTTLVDQYLSQLKIQVEPKDIDERFQQIQEEAKKSGEDFAAMLKKLQITEVELKKELHAALRWDKFVLQQGTDKVLLDYFQKNPSMFDSSEVHARHILIEAKDEAEGKQKIDQARKYIEDETAKELAKLPPAANKVEQEANRNKALLTAFAQAADRDSVCPSKKHGGDLGWFPRVRAMVEPFARAAFALQPYQLSDAVKTEFGYHLILTVDRKAGREVKYEDVKGAVAEIYAERLREAILASYKPRSKIVIHEYRQ